MRTFAGLLLVCVGCAGPESEAPVQPGRATAPGPSWAEVGSPLSGALVPAFEGLAQAVSAGEDQLARAILARILARSPTGEVLERARAFERILEGRRFMGRLDIGLVCRGGEDESDPLRLVFRGTVAGSDTLELRCGPPLLRFLVTAVDARGIEQRFARTGSIDDLAEVTFSPREPFELDLGPIELPLGSSLAVRGRFEVEFHSGEIVARGRVLPASGIEADFCETVRRAPFLPRARLEPGVVAEYAARPNFTLPALMERAVRVRNADRAEALEALAPLVAEMNRPDLARLVPALRWLSGSGRPGGDPEAWRSWMRVTREPEVPERRALDLPVGEAKLLDPLDLPDLSDDGREE